MEEQQRTENQKRKENAIFQNKNNNKLSNRRIKQKQEK